MQRDSALDKNTKDNNINIKHATHKDNEYDEDDDDEDQETKQLRSRKTKLNGFYTPFSSFQILSWLLLFLETLWAFSVLRAFMSTDTAEHVIFLILHCVSFGMMFIFGFLACFTNPSDPLVALQKSGVELPDCQRTHLCNVCKVFVGSKTKHCGVCNRCVSDFDHHCQWLNNCVGKANYRFFIAFTSWILIALLINIAFTAYSLSLRNTDYQSYVFRTQHQSILNSSKNAFFSLAVTALVFNIIASILSAELLIYHIWLKCTGKTTYEHILERRKRAEELKRIKQTRDHQENSSIPQVSQKSSKITIESGNKTALAIKALQLQQLQPPEGQLIQGMNRTEQMKDQMKKTGFTTPKNRDINIHIQNASPVDNNNQDLTQQPLHLASTNMHADSSMEIEQQQLFLNQNFNSDKKDTPGRQYEKHNNNMYLDNGLTQNQTEDKNSVLLSVRTKDSRAIIDIEKVEEVVQIEEKILKDTGKGLIKDNGSKLSLGSQTAVISQKQIISQQVNRGNELEMLNNQETQSEKKRNGDAIRAETPQIASSVQGQKQQQTKNSKNKIMPARA